MAPTPCRTIKESGSRVSAEDGRIKRKINKSRLMPSLSDETAVAITLQICQTSKVYNNKLSRIREIGNIENSQNLSLIVLPTLISSVQRELKRSCVSAPILALFEQTAV